MQMMPKAKCVEIEMQNVTPRTYRRRIDFYYKGMKSKLKLSCSHVYHFEDIWADCRDEEHIRKMDYCQLIIEKILDLGVADIPNDIEDTRDLLKKKVMMVMDIYKTFASYTMVPKGEYLYSSKTCFHFE